MKKFYRMKEPLASHIDALYGAGISKVISHKFTYQKDKDIKENKAYTIFHQNMGRSVDTYLEDVIGFSDEDFEILVEYDPKDWNEYPGCIPPNIESGNFYICRCKGKHPETHKEFIPTICRFLDGHFWDETTNFEINLDEGSFDECAHGPFIFKKLNFPKDLT